MTWNYRIGTELFETIFKSKDPFRERVYSIITVYYNNDGEPITYGGKTPAGDYNNYLSHLSDVEELEGTLNLIKLAFEKPVIDLDNFPNTFDNTNKKHE